MNHQQSKERTRRRATRTDPLLAHRTIDPLLTANECKTEPKVPELRRKGPERPRA